MARPVWSVTEVAVKPFSFIKNYFRTQGSVVEENLYLKEQLSSFQNKAIDYEILSKENDDLKNQLGRTGNTTKIVARILSKPPVSPYDTFVVDAGEIEGVLPLSKVYVSENILVGEVKSVTPHTSLVQLFSTGGSEQEVVSLRTGSSFSIFGLGGGNFKIEVPKDVDILWGDSFVYPGLSSGVIGNVYYIDTNAQSSFKVVYLRTPINVFGSKYVFIEKPI